MSTFRITLLALLCPACVCAWSSEWTEPVEVHQRITPVVSYRAKLDGDILLIEAKHAPGWHTYAMDNIERACARTGKQSPETELPTVIRTSGALTAVGPWYQTKPKDLSQEEIKWYTWGFEGVSLFAAKVRIGDGEDLKVIIDAQACNASSCKMIRNVLLSFPVPPHSAEGPATSTFDLGELVPVDTAAKTR